MNKFIYQIGNLEVRNRQDQTGSDRTRQDQTGPDRIRKKQTGIDRIISDIENYCIIIIAS